MPVNYLSCIHPPMETKRKKRCLHRHERKTVCRSKTCVSTPATTKAMQMENGQPWVQMKVFCGGTKTAVFRDVKKKQQPTRYGSPITTHTYTHLVQPLRLQVCVCGCEFTVFGKLSRKKSYFSLWLFPHLGDVFEEGERTSRTKHTPWHFSTSVSVIIQLYINLPPPPPPSQLYIQLPSGNYLNLSVKRIDQ